MKRVILQSNELLPLIYNYLENKLVRLSTIPLTYNMELFHNLIIHMFDGNVFYYILTAHNKTPHEGQAEKKVANSVK